MKHEMDQSEVLTELLNYDWDIRVLELAFQAHARDGLMQVQQLSGGMVGQTVTVHSRIPGEPSCEVGKNWPTYNREEMKRLYMWGEYSGIKGLTDEDWTKNYGTWKEDLGNGLVRIRIMITQFPPSIFDGFETEMVDHYERFPNFMPIEVIVPAWCVVSVEIPLGQTQLAVKYNFEEDIIFARAKMYEQRAANTSAKRNQTVTEFIEFLIIKPTMLIHNYTLRNSIYSKLEGFMQWTTMCNDIKYCVYIHDLVDRMTTVLSMVLEDSLCVKGAF